MLRPTLLILLAMLSGLAPSCLSLEPLEGGVEATEIDGPADLEAALNAYRTDAGLGAVPMSPELRKLAELHLRDLEANDPPLPCSLHSWSQDGPWTACCYEQSEPNVECMINKPLELTGYTGRGFEIAVSLHGPRPLTAELALHFWRESQSHDDVIMSRGPWKAIPWKAFGAAISDNYAVVWFGDVEDTASTTHPRSNANPNAKPASEEVLP